MARYISLFETGKSLGQFDLPERIVGVDGHEFRLIKAVGGGGNGVVFRARPVGSLGDELDHCAVKLLRQQESSRRDRFANEARIMRRLDHPRVAQFFDEGSVELSLEVSVP
jgi:serine/threonine protein kinase